MKARALLALLTLACALAQAQGLGQLVHALEAELREQRVRPGDRVLIVAENCPEHVALILACSRVGAWSCGINAHLRQHLAPYKRPQRVEVLPQLPMTASGKVIKRELRAFL